MQLCSCLFIYLFFCSFVAVDRAVQAHNMLFSTFPAEVFLLMEVCLGTVNKNLCIPVSRQTGVLKDKAGIDKNKMQLLHSVGIILSVSRAVTYWLNKRRERFIVRKKWRNGVKVRRGKWWSLLLLLISWTSRLGRISARGLYVSGVWKLVSVCYIVCASVWVCPRFLCLTLFTCVCVCACKLRCGLSLSIEVCFFFFWRGTLRGVSKGHVWPQKEWINAVVINGDTHAQIHTRSGHTLTRTNGCWERRFYLLIYSPERASLTMRPVAKHM